VNRSPTRAVPVLWAAVRIRVPAIRLARAVQVMPAVNLCSRLGIFTVVIAPVTDWSVSTVSVSWKVAPIEGYVIHCCFWVVTSMGAKQVLRFSFCTQAMPECPAVELIRKPSGAKVFAVNMFVLRCAVWWDGWCGLTVFIAFITYGSSSTLGGPWEVATTKSKIKHGGF